MMKAWYIGLLYMVCMGCQPKAPARNAKPATVVHADSPCTAALQQGISKNKINGISLVAPPRPYGGDPTADIQAVGANWVALLPYAYYRKNQPEIRDFGNEGWWGERPVGISEAAQYAQQRGMKVLLKPQIWTHDQWVGDLKFDTEADWVTFEENYSAFILKWARLADSLQLSMFCIGTELRYVVQQRPNYWRKLIQNIRSFYDGQLTYAPNWDSYEAVPFWDDLDYIGVDAYFPLLAVDTPTVCQLKTAWIPKVEALEAFAQRYDKPILFTEYGYLSADGATYNTWELEAKREQLRPNELAQARAFQALLETFAPHDWWAGGFVWKWYPSQLSAIGEGQQQTDYTPQGKLGAKVLKALFEGEDG